MPIDSRSVTLQYYSCAGLMYSMSKVTRMGEGHRCQNFFWSLVDPKIGGWEQD